MALRPDETNPSGDAERVSVLCDIALLDTAPETEFDHIVSLAKALAGTPIALISLVDQHRQWFKSKVGIDAEETPREYAFCHHAILQDDLLWIEDAMRDQRFAYNPLVVSPPYIRFYAGAPIKVRGSRIGTVCVASTEPRPRDDALATQLQMLADLAATQCEYRLTTIDMYLKNSPGQAAA
jgi:GAF domain-containing protein